MPPSWGANALLHPTRHLDHLGATPIVLFGSSMGAAVALQTAAEDARVSAVIFAALSEPKRLVAVPDCGHSGCLTTDVWHAIDQWMDQTVAR